jgi:hypothetical protein
MRKFYYVLILCAFTISCDKQEISQDISNVVVKKELSKSEIILKNNLNQTAKIIAGLVKEKR